MDKILLSGISCTAYLGVLSGEKETAQEILIDLVLGLDLEAAAKADQVQLTVDYRQVVSRVQMTVEQSRFHLLEALASELCQTVLRDNKIESVRITVRKFPESLRDKLTDVAVEMTRQTQRDAGSDRE